MKTLQLIFLLFTLTFTISCNVDKKENSENGSTEKKSNEIKIIAHRGGAELAPENTIAAFKNAINLGVDMIEIDVILSKDEEVIVIHDATIDRTTNGSGIVKDMTLAEIKKYDAGSWFGTEFIGEKIPTLEEVFETLDGRAILLIEIKDGDEKYPGLEKKVVNLIHKYDANEWVIVQSFNENSVIRVKESDNKILTYYLIGKNFSDYFEKEYTRFETEGMSNKKYDGLALHHSEVNKKNVEKIKKLGYSLFVWTINDIEEMKKMINLGVDGIITNLPDKLNEVLHN